MNLSELETACRTLLLRGVDPMTEVVVNCNAFNADVPEWAVVQGVGDPSMPMQGGDDDQSDWIWVTLHLVNPFFHEVDAADCRWTFSHDGPVHV